jgi:beta-ureidopropionase
MQKSQKREIDNGTLNPGRPATIVSISMARKVAFEKTLSIIEREARQGADLICLPECWHGNEGESINGPTITACAQLARRYSCYLICPIYRMDGNRRFNSAILLDRKGKVVCVYDKLYPYWDEFDLQPLPIPGIQTMVYDADFGRVGMAVCFDVNFPEVWQSLADQGAELVVWSSAYAGGTALQAHALNHHYYIVTSTLEPDCLVYDITGENILSRKGKSMLVSRIILDLDRGIYHDNFNIEKRDRLLAEHGNEIMLEKTFVPERWFVLKARRPGISARALARQYGLEELRAYVVRSRKEIERRRDDKTE